MLKNKKILLGITGSIAAHKSIDLTRRLTEEGASVYVVMTGASRKFVTPLSFAVASRNTVYEDTFQDPLSHITLTENADLLVVAPATANSIGKFAGGIADDLLSATFLAFRGPVIIAPAMNWRMYQHPVFQRNLAYLDACGVLRVGPVVGSLACGDEAIGRMADVQEIVEKVRSVFCEKDLSGKKIIITAGPTREYIDPVRFISNRSSGKMGYALACSAVRRGAHTVLVSGPCHLHVPAGAEVVQVETGQEMRDAVFTHLEGAAAVIMAGAVADFRPCAASDRKIEKTAGMTLEMEMTRDILAELGSLSLRPLLVGFAAETGSSTVRAKKKLIEKGADLIIFNNVLAPGSGFDVDTNEITIIEKDSEDSFPLMTKDEAADLILDRIKARLTP